MRLGMVATIVFAAMLSGCDSQNLDEFPLPSDYCRADGITLSDDEKVLRVLFDIHKGRYDGSQIYRTELRFSGYASPVLPAKVESINSAFRSKDIRFDLRPDLPDDEILKELKLFVEKNKESIVIRPAESRLAVLDRVLEDDYVNKDGFVKLGYVRDLYFFDKKNRLIESSYAEKMKNGAPPPGTTYLLTNCGEIFVMYSG